MWFELTYMYVHILDSRQLNIHFNLEDETQLVPILVSERGQFCTQEQMFYAFDVKKIDGEKG